MIIGQGEMTMKAKASNEAGFFCQECGHAFRTIKAAEKASFGDEGCPRCGGSDIDLGRPTPSDPIARSL